MASSQGREQPPFRAPPPSPITGRSHRYRSEDDSEDDELAHFLDHSFDNLPELILPDRIFPSEIPVVDPPKIDFRSFISRDDEDSSSLAMALETAAGLGCFQLLNHGISDQLIRCVTDSAEGIFRVSEEKKAMLQRSHERRYGFETILVDEEEEDEKEASQEFYWPGRLPEEEEALKKVMEMIWPTQFEMFSRMNQSLWVEVERVATEIVETVLNSDRNGGMKTRMNRGRRNIDVFHEEDGPVVCVSKHGGDTDGIREMSSLKSEVIRMLIRRSDYPHAVCINFCNSAPNFHIYSSRVGWLSFSPAPHALIVTFGDQMQEWTDGLYKHAVGRAVFHGVGSQYITLSFMFSPGQQRSRNSISFRPTTVADNLHDSSRGKTLSVNQQLFLCVCFTLLYHFVLYIFKFCSS